MKQRAAKPVNGKLCSKKRKNGKIITEAPSYLKGENKRLRYGPRQQLSLWPYSSTAVCRVVNVTILPSIPHPTPPPPPKIPNKTTYPNFG